ncbi:MULTISPECIES: lipoprotein [unclassified Streptomyces]|uniref:lipoprotein n=1 Tax=unclassified Streptomyces TaxID=2593676 RepID=UPI0040424E63
MRVRVGFVGRGAAVAVALATLLGGCAGSADGDGKSAAGASPSGRSEADAAAAKGGSVGAAGSDCALPVRFDVAEDWKAKAIDAEQSKASKGSGDDLSAAVADALLHQGPVTAACEIDAKPAGHIGFLRVWTGKAGAAAPGTVLRQFVAAEDGAGKATYRSVRTGGGLKAVEVEYLYTSKLLGETKKETALAVGTPDGPVVLHLGGMDTEEHEAMRPAYELAKQTLRLS